jgi:adenosine kinase
MDILITGSLAYDRIMTFPGKFADHILPDKIHILNVCFLLDGMEEKFGGTAGNIAYNLSMLGVKPRIISAVGHDFDRYAARLEAMGLDLAGLETIDSELTAGAYITTDKSDNQITGFNPGAMKFRSARSLDGVEPAASLAIISPGNLDDMIAYAAEYRERGIPFIFDPGQQIPAFEGGDLLESLTGAAVLISNDYELEMIMKATGKDRAGLLERVGAIITTLGDQGSIVVDSSGETRVGAATAAEVKDPTGAGDAFRAGLIKGLIESRTLPEAAGLGAAVASFCVEHHGTQEHVFDEDSLSARLREAVGPDGWAGALGAIMHHA